MKITAVFVFVLSMSIYANSYGQSEKVNLVKNSSLREIIEELEQVSGYHFVLKYDAEILDKKVNANYKNEKIEYILDDLLKDTGFNYKIIDRYIAISRDENATEQVYAIKVTGKVTDTTGAPLLGVTVVVKGTTNGTITDFDGVYNLSDVPSDGVIQFSFVGMKMQEIPIGGKTSIDVELEEDAIGIEEVVAVGYGTIKKRDVIGSVASIKGNELQEASSASFLGGMQGRAAGVSIRSTSGTPGAPVTVQVRGVNSINTGTDPLWVIDGMPVYSGSGIGRTAGTVAQNPMSTINPKDIESIEILKDAAATAIYGSRGSNGVIILTTKRGNTANKKGKVSFDVSSGISNLVRSPESIGFANTSEWFEIMDIAKTNGGRDVFEPGDIFNANFKNSLSREEALQVNTDWFDVVLRQGTYSDANFSYSQGLENGSIYMSFNYRKDKAVNVGNDFDRWSGLINADFEPVKGLSTGAKLNVMYTNNYRNKTNTSNPGASDGTAGGFGAATTKALPWYPIYDENDPSGYWNPEAGNLAAIADRDLMLDNKKTYRALGNLYVEYLIPGVNGLSVRAEASADVIQDNSVNWISGSILNSAKTFVYEGAITRSSHNYNTFLKYNTKFNDDHSINMVAGVESQRTSQYNRELQGRDPVGYNQELGSTSPGEKDVLKGYMKGERYLRSYFGRLNYKFKDKYILGASFRRDGSSAFSSNVRWGNFASLSAGWIISEESFFASMKESINLLKLRGSFGQTGNQSIPDNKNISTLGNSEGNRYGSPDILNAGSTIAIGNENITWEVTDSYDAGVDFGLFGNRISGSVAYYIQNVSDMLLQVSTPPSAAIGSVFDNVGDMKNWGWELNLNSVNYNRNNFKWTSSFNFSTNKNEVLRLTPEMERQKGQQLFVGGRLGLFKMSEYAGIDPERGVHMIWEIDRTIYAETGEYVKTGRKIPFTDTNSKLHEVVLEDKSKIPTFFGGFDNTFSYKGFDLGVFFTFSGGNYTYNGRMKDWTNPSNGYWMKLDDLLDNQWERGKENAKYPLLFMEGFAPATTKWDVNAIDPNTGLKGWWKNPDVDNLEYPNARETYDKNGGKAMTKYLEKADYLRLKSVTVGYSLPQVLVRKLQLENLRIYGSATNLLTFTKYSGFDPETAGNANLLPSVKTFSLGVNLTL